MNVDNMDFCFNFYLEGGGELAAISCSTVAQCSDLDHCVAASESFSLIAFNNGPMYSRMGSMSIIAMYSNRWKSLMAVRNSSGLNCERYWESALKS